MRLLPRRKGAAADSASGVTRSTSHIGRSRLHHSANPYDDDDNDNRYDRRGDWEDHGGGCGGGDFFGGFAPSRSSIRQYEDMVAPKAGGGAAAGGYYDDNSYGSRTNNGSIRAPDKKQQHTPGSMLRKLSCSASKRDAKEQLQQENEIEAVHQPPSSPTDSWQKRSSWGVSIPQLRRSKSQSDITRPVLITVKDGDFANRHGSSSQYDHHHHHHDGDEHKAEDQFVVGKLPRNHPARSSSIPFRLGISVRNRQQAVDRSPKTKSERSTRNDLASASKSPLRRCRSSSTRDTVYTSISKEQQDGNHNLVEDQEDVRPTEYRDMRNFRTAEEVARKERWRRGLELERKMWQEKLSTSCALGGGDGGGGGDAGSGCGPHDADSLADGSHTTGTGTRDHHSRGEYSRSSAGYTTDQTDTDDSDEYDNQGRYNGVRVLSKSFNQNQRMFQGVAEDLGIVARMILADGTACMGTAAAITSETVAGCKSG